MTFPTMSFISVVVLFASQPTIFPDDALQVQCGKYGCEGSFQDFRLKYVDTTVHAVLRHGKLIVSYSGVNPIYDDWTELKQEFISAVDDQGRKRKLSDVKRVCIISNDTGSGWTIVHAACTTVHRDCLFFPFATCLYK